MVHSSHPLTVRGGQRRREGLNFCCTLKARLSFDLERNEKIIISCTLARIWVFQFCPVSRLSGGGEGSLIFL